MTKTLTLFAPLLALALLVGLQCPPALALATNPGISLTGSEDRQIAAGQIVVKVLPTNLSTMRDVIAVGYVEAPVKEVWRVITDYHNYPKIFPNIKKSETRYKKGLVEHHFTELDYPWPLPDKWTLNEIVHEPAKYTARWHRLDGSVKETVGQWRLLAEGKRTLVVYTVRVDPGLPLVPQWAIEWATTRVAPQIIGNVRKHARS